MSEREVARLTLPIPVRELEALEGVLTRIYGRELYLRPAEGHLVVVRDAAPPPHRPDNEEGTDPAARDPRLAVDLPHLGHEWACLSERERADVLEALDAARTGD